MQLKNNDNGEGNVEQDETTPSEDRADRLRELRKSMADNKSSERPVGNVADILRERLKAAQERVSYEAVDDEAPEFEDNTAEDFEDEFEEPDVEVEAEGSRAEDIFAEAPVVHEELETIAAETSHTFFDAVLEPVAAEQDDEVFAEDDFFDEPEDDEQFLDAETEPAIEIETTEDTIEPDDFDVSNVLSEVSHTVVEPDTIEEPVEAVPMVDVSAVLAATLSEETHEFDEGPPSEAVVEPRIAVPSLDDPDLTAKLLASASGGRKRANKTRVLGFDAAEEEPDPFANGAQVAPSGAEAVRYPTGWVLVMDGPGRGKHFALGLGVAQIGRGEDQAIRLDFGDTSISRENHAAIAFDPENKAFFLGQGGKANLVRLNGKPVLSNEQMNHCDEVRIGETTLRLIALCGPDFSWGEANDDDGRGQT